MAAAVLHVCVTCKGAATVAACTDCPSGGADAAQCANCPLAQAGAAPGGMRAGAQLAAALADLPCPEGVTIREVECLSACSQGCSVALSAPGKWSYVYGRLTAGDAIDILLGAAAYARAADGIVPWRDRPTIFRKQSLARIPPIDI
ncbi:DUF1636 domain-containing protein [Aliigemmobacter aestuarii]|uniref:DUF1636 domain-containing protein n=1 Tax=Aliigemmobacter aestuarii TaxID=1445661 RepID=A0A4S3MSA3_9RHOB|nr:DUF1636 domain-containing protein [Gemmobacter aestuarii]THD84725.1 DUF1636 domain-containing protein [Gemmobacter aestuarii]